MTYPSKVEDEMTPYPVITFPKATVSEAVDMMESHRIRHLPVVEHGKVVGIVSDRDLKQATLLTDSMHLLVSDVMTPNPYCVRVGTPLIKVAREMAKQKYGCTVVLNARGRVIGIFTTTDGMKVLGEILDDESPESMKTLGIENFLESSYLN